MTCRDFSKSVVVDGRTYKKVFLNSRFREYCLCESIFITAPFDVALFLYNMSMRRVSRLTHPVGPLPRTGPPEGPAPGQSSDWSTSQHHRATTYRYTHRLEHRRLELGRGALFTCPGRGRVARWTLSLSFLPMPPLAGNCRP